MHSQFVEAAKTAGADVVALSALLTVAMPSMRSVIEALVEAGMCDRVKVMVGGAPVTRRYSEDIGADLYGENASDAVAAARRAMALV